jgi:hypothetical protein
MSTSGLRAWIAAWEELTYRFHDGTFTVTQCGRICFESQKVNLSQVFCGAAILTTRRAGSSRARIPSARECYLCARNERSPM